MPRGEENVLRLDVAVDHSLLVGIVQRFRDLPSDPERLLQRELTLALEPLPQGLALDEGHDVEELTCGLAGVEQGQDVGVLELGGESDLAQEPLGAEHGGELGAEDLEGDRRGRA